MYQALFSSPLSGGESKKRTGDEARLVHARPQGEVVDALLAVIMTAREHLWLCVVLMTDGTGDLLF